MKYRYCVLKRHGHPVEMFAWIPAELAEVRNMVKIAGANGDWMVTDVKSTEHDKAEIINGKIQECVKSDVPNGIDPPLQAGNVMNYYLVEFEIVGRHGFRFSNFGESEDGGLAVAQSKLCQDLNQAKICAVHAYCWCDGSTYLHVRSNCDEARLLIDIDNVLEAANSPFRVHKTTKETNDVTFDASESWRAFKNEEFKKMLERFDWHDWEQTLTEEQKALSYHKKLKLFQTQKEDQQQALDIS